MPISEDEFEYRHPQDSQLGSMSKAELRKTHKPIMEKRRRARINHCLNEIKSLILEAMNKDPARHSKLEKADILEMAVKHLQDVQRQQLAVAMATDSSVLRKFKSGFNDCATEIDKYVSQMDGVEAGVKDRMRSHLQKCITGIEQVSHFNFPGFSNLPFVTSGVFQQSRDSGDLNNNAGVQLPQSIQLIPSRLPSGELALLVPNSSLPFLSRDRPSAFAAVIPSSTIITNSPPSSPNPSFRGVSQDSPQVPQVSSTLEVKPMKFPIHQPSPKKHSEALSVITNQSERFKQAQRPGDSMHLSENRQGTKRKYSEISSHGLLTFMSPDLGHPSSKVVKVETVTSSSEREPSGFGASTSRESGESSDSMWRPW